MKAIVSIPAVAVTLGVAALALCGPANAAVISLGTTVIGPSGEIVPYTVTTSGLYDITAYGADGTGDGGGTVYPFGTAGGLGAALKGQFALAANEQLYILVGGMGGGGGADGGGGGGGSFVVLGNGPAGVPLIIAGGGGGGGIQGSHANGFNATTTATGTIGVAGHMPGSDGNGGDAGGATGSGGGGGFIGNGGSGYSGPINIGGAPGDSYINGGSGGVPSNGAGSFDFGGFGGFGGGGSGNDTGGGGGGGYNGGFGGYSGTHGAGGGGGSYLLPWVSDLLPANTLNTAGGGLVVITSVPEPGSFALLVCGLLGLGLVLRRRKRTQRMAR